MIPNIWAVGRNYAEHAKELGNAVPTSPMIFLKAGSCASLATDTIQIPPWLSEVHYEVELALRFNEKLEIDQACIAIDITDRKKQDELKKAGHPWTLAKSFRDSCPIGNFFPVKNLGDLESLNIILKVNGEIRQNGNTRDMIFKLQTLVDYVKKHFPVVPGDLLLTGTPSGVGPFVKGDVLEASIEGKTKHTWRAI